MFSRMHLRKFFLFLFVPVLSLSLISCDSGGDGDDDTVGANSFKATVQGSSVEKHELQGSMAIQQSDWGGSAFVLDIGGRLGDADLDSSLVYFGLTLSPESNTFGSYEAINITYLGSDLTAGTYDIVALDENSDRRGEFEEGVFRADYFKIGDSDSTRFLGDIEMYPASLGSITLSEVTTESVTGNFTFEAEICRCFNFNDVLERLMDGIDRDGNGGDWEDPFEDFEVERDLSAEGSFNVDIRRSDDFNFEDHGDGDGVRINRNPGQGRGR